MNITEFFAMGGYGSYVWSSFALTFFLMLWVIIQPMIGSKKLLRSIAQQKLRGQRS